MPLNFFFVYTRKKQDCRSDGKPWTVKKKMTMLKFLKKFQKNLFPTASVE